MKHLLLLVVAAGSLLAQSQLAQAQTGAQPKTGEIKGSVDDQDGRPVSDATVYAVPQGLMLDDITPRSVKTDRNGRFDFRGSFELEAYKLYARKDEDAIPIRATAFTRTRRRTRHGRISPPTIPPPQ
jgi:hypothetical protein